METDLLHHLYASVEGIVAAGCRVRIIDSMHRSLAETERRRSGVASYATTALL